VLKDICTAFEVVGMLARCVSARSRGRHRRISYAVNSQ